ncbi:TPA: YeeE/YedE family protein [Mannheimia haemolytica]|uniref:YeeE/YedE family protein n=1 Tax=Mannheimia haemolytica TaxID=75985 RepID=A0A547EM22_MANHA|nr:YeeE/YedE family protein [Mannheimia haemolytica]AGI31606.1 YeeE/YedE family protein [Mannheimia haemolytica USDA-ARS-USMARC-183]AGI36285.1 YeeE/YedE family protein [Mannheimia haemolytica USDA-ARS-USMARC-185]AGQ25608.1 ABC transporter permease [Mannheimia haemolytica D153]AGQ41164.1 ABC transporter permease [Mannheimia haemolytica D174]AWW70547.1 YeeE/YedE family protein [Pasteurellaceae bacterium 12565]
MLFTGLLCGFLLGFVMQRGRFCITGAFRDLYVTKNSRMFVALLIAITVQSIGIWLLYEAGSFSSPAEDLPLLAVIIGAFLFGIGIIYAGGCATGTWYRAGEGLIGSWVALVIYGLFSASMRTGVLAPLNQELKSNVIQHRTIYETFGISPWVLVFILSVITLALSAHSI